MVHCKPVQRHEFSKKFDFVSTVKLEILATRNAHLRRTRKPQFFIGYFDECGCFEEIAKIKL